jgi:hypothetical protein
MRKKSGKQYHSHNIKKLKHLEKNLMKKMKELYNENYKSLKKENKDIRRWKDILC